MASELILPITGSLLSFGANDLLKAIDSWVDSGAVWLLDEVGQVLTSTTDTDLGSSWFGARFSLMAELAAAAMLPMLCLAVIQAIYRQSAATLLRIFFVNLPTAFLLTGVAVELVRIGIAVTDVMSARFLALSGQDTRQVLVPVASDLSAGIPGVPGFALFLAGLIVAVAAFILWIELVIRAAAITAAALFLPLVLAALVWPAIGHWARRLADTLASLVLSKLVIAAVISLAVGALSGAFTGPTVSTRFGDLVVGIALLLLATVSPFVLLRLIPAFEAGAVSHLESQRRRATGQMREGIGTGSDIAKKLGGKAAVALPAVGEVVATAISAIRGAGGSVAAAAGSSGSKASGVAKGITPIPDEMYGPEPTQEHIDDVAKRLAPPGMTWTEWTAMGEGSEERSEGGPDAPEPEAKDGKDA